jgi:hypothetical protein
MRDQKLGRRRWNGKKRKGSSNNSDVVVVVITGVIAVERKNRTNGSGNT